MKRLLSSIREKLNSSTDQEFSEVLKKLGVSDEEHDEMLRQHREIRELRAEMLTYPGFKEILTHV